MIWGWVFVAGYLLGAIPVGQIVARLKGVDLLSTGSGNIGATNVGRILGKKAAATVFALDVLKGLLPALVGRLIVPDGAVWGLSSAEVGLLAGALAVAGHMASPFLKFRGGKGVATGLGAMIGASPLVALIAFGAFLVVVLLTRIISLGAVLCMPVMMIAGFMIEQSIIFRTMFVVLGGLIIYRHRANIVRLRQGTEPKFQFGHSGKNDPAPRS